MECHQKNIQNKFNYEKNRLSMTLKEEMSKYQKIYDICFSKLIGLVEKEREQYLKFLVESRISIITDLYGIVRYFSPQKELTKEEVNNLYEKWTSTK